MPTYEYKCRECAHRVEVVQAFTDKSLTKCKECGGSLGKVFGNIGISFKGSGFYRTDSRSAAKASSSNSKEASTSKDPSTSKDGGKSGSSDSKSEKVPEKKSETKTESPSKSNGSEKKAPAPAGK